MINLFEQFLNTEELMNHYHISCSSGWVCLLVLKELVLEILSSTHVINAFNVPCLLCGKEPILNTMKPLFKTFFNIVANNFALLLNRRNVANKITLKLVKKLIVFKSSQRCTKRKQRRITI